MYLGLLKKDYRIEVSVESRICSFFFQYQACLGSVSQHSRFCGGNFERGPLSLSWTRASDCSAYGGPQKGGCLFS